MARSPVRPPPRSVRAFTPKQLDACVAVYQPVYGDEPITPEKAGEILHNVTSVYALLASWARRADRSAAARKGVQRRREATNG